MFAARLHLITPPSWDRWTAVLETVERAVEGGVDLVQFRDKSHSVRQMVERGAALRSLCSSLGVPLVVNDRVDIAMAIGADGVHLGGDDLPWSLARQMAPRMKMLGCTAASPPALSEALGAKADYVGAGPAFATPTKSNAGPRMDAGAYEELCSLASAHDLPVIAIGGIEPGRLQPLVEAGVFGVAVCSTIFRNSDPRRCAEQIASELGTTSHRILRPS